MVRKTTIGLTSVIIPVLGETAVINDVIANVRQAAHGLSVEIVVADGDPQGATLAAIEDSSVTGVIAPRGRGAQMNAGAREATGDVLLFLHADTRLPDHAISLARKALERAEAGSFTVRYDTRSRWVRFLGMVSNVRARLERVAYGDQTHFFRAETFHAVGGYPEIPIMEDVEMFQRLRREARPVALLSDKVLTSARRYETEGPLRRPFRNILLRLRHRLGASPQELAGNYRPQCDLERQ